MVRKAETNAQASLDQTTRIHAAIPFPGGDTPGSVAWHEVGRPQVHGYDLVGVAALDALRFVSIADEKVARVFEAPREFIQVLDNLGIANLATGSVEVSQCISVKPHMYSAVICRSDLEQRLCRPFNYPTKQSPMVGGLDCL